MLFLYTLFQEWLPEYLTEWRPYFLKVSGLLEGDMEALDEADETIPEEPSTPEEEMDIVERRLEAAFKLDCGLELVEDAPQVELEDESTELVLEALKASSFDGVGDSGATLDLVILGENFALGEEFELLQ